MHLMQADAGMPEGRSPSRASEQDDRVSSRVDSGRQQLQDTRPRDREGLAQHVAMGPHEVTVVP